MSNNKVIKRDNGKLAIKLANDIAQAFDETENDINTIMTVCAYVAVPRVPVEILRLQLTGLRIALNARLEYYGKLLENQIGQIVASQRNIQEWTIIGTQIKDIHEGITVALDPDNPDDGSALRRALKKHMKPADRQRWEAIQREVEKLQRAEQAAKKAEIEAAEEQARLAEKIANLRQTQRRDGLCKWGIDEMMTEEEVSQLPAARLLRERLETVSKYQALTDEQNTVLIHLREVLNGSNPGQMIDKIMKDTVMAIKWENGTIRL